MKPTEEMALMRQQIAQLTEQRDNNQTHYHVAMDEVRALRQKVIQLQGECQAQELGSRTYCECHVCRSFKASQDDVNEAEQFRAAKKALDGRLGNYGLNDVEEACRQYVLAEDHLPDTFDDEDYTLSGAVKSLVEYKNERDLLLTRTQEMEGDVKLIESLDNLISGDDSVSLCEEDGGVICSVNRHKVQNNYVGGSVREALAEAVAMESHATGK